MSRVCPACRSQRLDVMLPERRHEYVIEGVAGSWDYRLLRCEECGLGMLDPEPSLRLLQTFYASDYGQYQPSTEAPGAGRSLKYRLARMRHVTGHGPAQAARRTIAGLFELLSGKTLSYSLALPLLLPLDAAIFELGFGDGSWLLSMRAQGFSQLYGYDIEVNRAHVSALEAQGIRVSSGDFLRNTYPEAAFDCIRMEHVFEHLTEPLQVLEKCRRMLKPAGVLVITSPCLDSWSTRLSLEHSPNGHEIPRHIYHHTAESARRMLHAAGFGDVRALVYGDAISLGATINGLRKQAGKRAAPRAAFSALNPLYRVWCLATGKGELVSVAARS